MTAATIHLGDCLEVLQSLEAGSVDAIVTDPPAGIAFMGASWDAFGVRPPGRSSYKAHNDSTMLANGRGLTVAQSAKAREAFLAALAPIFAECLRVIRPGGYALVWALPRTSHWTATALEDAGWEIRDRISHLFGQGFPKGKGCLKPAVEDWWLCRRPGPKVLPLGIEETRVAGPPSGLKPYTRSTTPPMGPGYRECAREGREVNYQDHPAGRWPANLVLDEEAARLLDEQAGERPGDRPGRKPRVANGYGGNFMDDDWQGRDTQTPGYVGSGGPSRFFYCSKAPQRERVAAADGTRHPTQKPEALMRWLVRLACPPGGLCLDPFLGSGTTGVACVQAGRRFVGCELDPGYYEIARRRIEQTQADCPLFAEPLP